MAKVKFTAGRLVAFHCEKGKAQSFLWCDEVPGLAVRATPGSTRKSYIFEARLNRKSVRLTIGRVSVWSISAAQDEARRLHALIINGGDPRRVKLGADIAASGSLSVTVGQVWNDYLAAMKSSWGELHLRDHIRAMQSGGEVRRRSARLTTPGPLASLAAVPLVDLTPERLCEWAKIEAAQRPSSARNARTLLTTFLNWCVAHPAYQSMVTANAAQDKKIKAYLGKPQPRADALQAEQLAAWFAAVKDIPNPVISAYLQAMLLTGARSNELIALRWSEANFRDAELIVNGAGNTARIIPLTPYLAQLLRALPRTNEFIFPSLSAESGHLVEPRIAHAKACAAADLHVTLHGLRRSFAGLCVWVEMPAGVAAQLQGYKTTAAGMQRPLDLLRKWHVKLEAWILAQADLLSVT